MTGACGKKEAGKFRSEVRLASSVLPEYTEVSHRPVLHYESDIHLGRGHPTYLKIPHETVGRHIEDGNGRELRVGREIPVSCRVHEKVFLNLDKADLDEKEDGD